RGRRRLIAEFLVRLVHESFPPWVVWLHNVLPRAFFLKLRWRQHRETAAPCWRVALAEDVVPYRSAVVILSGQDPDQHHATTGRVEFSGVCGGRTDCRRVGVDVAADYRFGRGFADR